jgi:NADH-quinone oxidoreductase subunit L
MVKIILFAPLIGALIAGFGWRVIGEKAAQWLTTGMLFLACVLSWVVFLWLDASTVQHLQILRWVESGTLSADWSIRVDRMTAIMLIVVTTVSALVHLYSFGYMDHDPQWKEGETYKPRFFCLSIIFYFCNVNACHLG